MRISLAFFSFLVSTGPGGEPLELRRAGLDLAEKTAARAAVDRGLSFLIGGQNEEGAWLAFERPHPAVTALAVKALAQSERYGPDHPAVRRGVAFVLRFVQRDGGIYVSGEGMRNYHTSVALLALSSFPGDRYRKEISRAQEFLVDLQWDGGEGHEASSSWYGGAGYGKHKRPDLSNTQLMLEALRQSGLPEDHPVYRKGLAFVSRCQMLGGSNDQVFARESADGGFVYTAANGGESKAGTDIEGNRPRLRSYGSMTYAGFKSMLYAGLTKEDSRVQAALGWIREHYTLDHNPNMPDGQSQEGLYYYYHTFSRALDAWGEEALVDGLGVRHYWRRELSARLISLQRADGSWFNEKDRWYEGNPHLVTAYAVLALQTVLD